MKVKKYLPTVLFVVVVVVLGFFALDYLGKKNSDSKQIPDQQKGQKEISANETVDQPLERKIKLNYPDFKTVKISVSDVSGGKAYVLNYEFDLANLNYRVQTDLEGGFYYSYVNGIVCFGKPKFENSFCVREKYTPAGLVAFLANSIDTPARELKPDEKEISRIMTEAGWVPQQYLSAFMIRAEVILKLLQAKQLNQDFLLKLRENLDILEKNLEERIPKSEKINKELFLKEDERFDLEEII